MDTELDQLADSLLARDPSGRSAEWGEFYERACPLLMSWMALHLYGAVRQRIDPADLAQETWVRALGSLTKYDRSRGSFLQWLSGISRNVVRGALHSLATRGDARGGTSNLELLDAQRDSVTGITARLASDDTLRSLIDYLRSQSDDDRTLLIACWLEGQPLTEAAARLGISAEAAAKRWQRLRTRLEASPHVARLLSP